MKPSINHYKYLERILPTFFQQLGLDWDMHAGIISAHGDKCYTYSTLWADAGIPFYKGAAMFLLTYVRPYSAEVRDVDGTWVRPDQWVINNSHKFLSLLPDAIEADKSPW